MFGFDIPHSQRIRRLSKEGFWIVLGNAMAVVGSIIGVRLFTDLLEPVAYGRLALGLTVASLAGQTVFGTLANGITRYYAPAQEKGDFGGYLNAIGRLMVLATGVILLMVIFSVGGLLSTGRTKWITIVTASLVFALLSGYNSILSGIQNAARQRSIVALHQGMESWARFLVAVGLMLWLGATTAVAIIGYGIAVVLVLGSQFIFFRSTVSMKINGVSRENNWREQIWKYSFPFASWGIFSWAQLASDRWALEFFATTKDVGLYAVLFQLGYYPMAIVTGMAVQLLAPIIYQRAGDASDNRRNAKVNSLCWRLTWAALGATGGAFLVTSLFHTLIFRILAGKEYAAISYLLPWMFLAGGVFAASQTISLNLMSQMKTHTMTMPKITTASMGIIFNFAGAYLYGITGIVMAGVLFSVSHFLWMAMLSKKIEAPTCAFGNSI